MSAPFPESAVPLPGERLATPTQPKTPSWSERYGYRHRLSRVTEFPFGVAAPRKVRLYYRLDHFVLQWWDPAANVCRPPAVPPAG